MNWFALKVFYNKVFEIRDLLTTQLIESYVPIIVVEREKAGRKVLDRKPAISSLMFFKGTEEDAVKVQKLLEGRAIVYHYAKSTKPIPIDEREMQIFMLVTRAAETGLDYFDADISKFSLGQRVRVTGGQFEGAEGYIKRIKGNRRLIVCIEGIVAVATTYIPSCFLQEISEVK